MCQKIRARLAKIRTVFRAEGGVALAEMAIIMSVLTFLGIAALDFGTAYARKMMAMNASRAAGEYALAWRPTCDAETSQSQLVNTRETIIDKLYEAAKFTEDEADIRANSSAEVSIYYQCSGGQKFMCGEELPEDAACETRSTYLEIRFTVPAEPILYNKVLGEQVSVATVVPLH